jgi:4-amino-4-deoxy-L-arabinose transferase-like glycosyltransferase
MSAPIAWIERWPVAAFAAFAALHAAVWTALPALLYPNLPLDLIEALTYGREWQLGYDKLPPLPWWLVEIAHRLADVDAAYYALAQAAVIAALALVFATARPLVGSVGALAAVLIIDGLHYFSYTAAKFNHDVVQLPFWALTGYAFHRALRSGRTGYWALLGLALGTALWAKYFVVILAIPLALYVLIDRKARQSLRSPGPYVAAAIALVVMAPHLVWLVRNDFLPFAYAGARAATPRGLLDHLLHPAQFILGQLFFLAPCLAIAASLVWSRPQPPLAPADLADRRIISLLTFAPAATLLVASVITGRGLIAMWGYPLWLFLGLWIVLVAGDPADRWRLTRAVTTWSLIFSGFALGFLVNYGLLPRFDHRYRAVFFPGDRLAAEMARAFRSGTGQPLAYVIGSMWVGGNIAHYAAEHPRVLIDGEPHRAPWIDLADLKARGAVVVWTEGDRTTVPAALGALAGGAQIQPPLALPDRRGDTMVVGWGIVPPQRPLRALPD